MFRKLDKWYGSLGEGRATAVGILVLVVIAFMVGFLEQL